MQNQIQPQDNQILSVHVSAKALGTRDGVVFGQVFNSLKVFESPDEEIYTQGAAINKRFSRPIILLSIFIMLAAVGFGYTFVTLLFAAFDNTVALIFFIVSIAALIILYRLLHFLIKKQHAAVSKLSAHYTQKTAAEFMQRIEFNGEPVPLSVFQNQYTLRGRKISTLRLSVLAFSAPDGVYLADDTIVIMIPKSFFCNAELTAARKQFIDINPAENAQKAGMFNKCSANSVGILHFNIFGALWTIEVPPYSFETAKQLWNS